MISKVGTALALCSAVILGACTDPGRLTPGTGLAPAGEKTANGALIGAGAGALLGALSRGDGNRDKGALKGAVIGGAIGAGVGYSLDRQEAQLRQQLNTPGVDIRNTGDRLIVTLPQDILFASGSTAVSPALQTDLGALARNIQANPGTTIQIVGHTDSDGSAEFNQQLSQGRAAAVGDVLAGQGVPYARMQTFGRGENQPVASNLNEEGKRQNRRVEIVILPDAV
jgi:outer membrane protein OmpA-like peptidoglycan-associated protein